MCSGYWDTCHHGWRRNGSMRVHLASGNGNATIAIFSTTVTDPLHRCWLCWWISFFAWATNGWWWSHANDDDLVCCGSRALFVATESPAQQPRYKAHWQQWTWIKWITPTNGKLERRPSKPMSRIDSTGGLLFLSICSEGTIWDIGR